MKRLVLQFSFALAAVAIAAAPLPALSASTLAADWLVTYYLDPNGTQGSTQCIVVTETAHSPGLQSGKWFSTTLKGWHGEWVQKGEHFAFHGFTGSNVATYDVGDFVNPNLATETSAAVFNFSNGHVSTVDTATAALVMVSSCSGARSHVGTDSLRDP